MIQRIALLIGGLGAAAILAFALGLVNFAVAWPWNAANTANTANVASVGDQPGAQALAAGGTGAGSQNAQPRNKTVVDKVYVAPAQPPKVIHVPSSASGRPGAQTTNPAAPPATTARTNSGGHDDSYPERESEHSAGHNSGDD